LKNKEGHDLYNELVPTATNPTTGFLTIFTQNDITHANKPVDKAIKMIVSAGKFLPEVVHGKMH
jgi:uncharacterized membrane protein